MTKTFKRLISALLAALMLLSVLSGCDGAESDPPAEPDAQTAPETPAEPEPPRDTLVAGVDGLSGEFSPFFAAADADAGVCGLVMLPLLASDREGNMLLNGLEGQTVAYNGTEYDYKGVADCAVALNPDGSVDYDLTLRDGVLFSDGEPLTADDVIFSMYVLADPSYDGGSAFRTLPIEGMESYRAGMTPKWRLIWDDRAAGKRASEYYSDSDAEAFDAALAEAGAAFAGSIVDYCQANYLEAYGEAVLSGYTLDEIAASPGLLTAFGMAMWGYAAERAIGDDGRFRDVRGRAYDLAEGPALADFWELIFGNFGYDLDAEDGINYESTGASFETYMNETLAGAYPGLSASVQTGASADSISGIQKTGAHSLKITMTSFDAAAVYQLGLPVAPLHYYGDAEAYDYENNMFGFTKGDLSGVRALSGKPLGAGPYKFLSYENGVVSFEANELYYKGCPLTKYILFQETAGTEKLAGLADGTLDVAEPPLSDETVSELKRQNGGELSGGVLTTLSADYPGYGYIAIQAQRVSVAGDAASEASRNLRKGFATLFAVYREAAVEDYFGERAGVIQYPISNTSWAAPRPSDEGYRAAYSTDIDDKPIYTDGMTPEQRYGAALAAAIGYFEAAGYVWDAAGARFTQAPEGASLTYELRLVGYGAGEHPSYGIAAAAAEALEKIGFTLNITDLSDSSALWDEVAAVNVDMWCAAWQATPDPDMYQVYYSENSVTLEGAGTNYYGIMDAELDELILAARASSDTDYRRSVYKTCLDLILDWACEIPAYQRQEAVVFSSERVDASTVTPDVTAFWSWMNDLETLKMK